MICIETEHQARCIGRALVLEINALDTVADACQHLVWNGSDDVAKHSNRQAIAKDFDAVSLFTIDPGHVDHSHILSDVAHIVSLLTVD